MYSSSHDLLFIRIEIHWASAGSEWTATLRQSTRFPTGKLICEYSGPVSCLRLRKRVSNSRHLGMKIVVCRAILLSALVCDSESRTLYQHRMRMHDRSHLQRLASASLPIYSVPSDLHRIHRPIRPGTSGCVLTARVIKNVRLPPVAQPPMIGRSVSKAALRGSDSLLLGVVYRSPSSSPEDDHFLTRTLGQHSFSYHFSHLLLLGEFTAPKAPWTEPQCVGQSGPFTAALSEVVQQSAWTQHVVAPTRYREGQQPSLLDLVITNERHFVDQVTINAPLGHSDHCVLTFDFICYWARNPEPQTWIRNFCRADFSGMRIFLNQVKLGPASVEDLYRTIVQKVHEADTMFVPKKPARSRMSRKLPKRIRRLLEKRSQLFLKKLTTGDTEDELAFRKMRNRCKSEIRQWNIRKQATILDLARKNRNVLFKYMRHRRRNKPSAFSLRDRNGEPTSDPIVVSEFYRDHYAGDSANSFVMHGEKGPEDITRIDAKKDLGIWLSPNLSFSLHLEKSAQKAFAVLRMIRRTFSRITRTDFQILYGAYVRPLLEYANPVVYSGRTKDVILIERVQRAATKMVAGLKSMDYETRLVVLDLFPLEYRRLRGDLILTCALFEQGLANRFFTVDPANTRRGHGERQLLNDKNKTDPGNLGKSLNPVYQSVNPYSVACDTKQLSSNFMSSSGNWCLIESDPAVFTELIRGFGTSVLPSADRLIQVITNACATQAIINILLNLDDKEVVLGDTLKEFKSFVADFDSSMKGTALSNSDQIRTVHNSFSNYQIFEFDEKISKKEEDVYHFVGYVPIDGVLYELDGLKEGPVDHGSIPENQSWLTFATPILQKRMQRCLNGNFNLLAVVPHRLSVYQKQLAQVQQSTDGTESAELVRELEKNIEREKEKAVSYRQENTRRRHNYLPLIIDLMKILAENSALVNSVERAKKMAQERKQAKTVAKS
ncbi:ubiquitin carboxyl-terminal hydrolase L5 [Clonorchis sinensis]|uniref:ubiquitinyl hydrolase 1 n=1 Tax=Clonorchis sinensis TaxID=79923 RepID=G7Y4B3_CLOSI|nr:ubiquitin carboxyl-terminal hydrolase L5 [Clonorchis sinensis]